MKNRIAFGLGALLVCTAAAAQEPLPFDQYNVLRVIVPANLSAKQFSVLGDCARRVNEAKAALQAHIRAMNERGDVRDLAAKMLDGAKPASSEIDQMKLIDSKHRQERSVYESALLRQIDAFIACLSTEQQAAMAGVKYTLADARKQARSYASMTEQQFQESRGQGHQFWVASEDRDRSARTRATLDLRQVELQLAVENSVEGGLFVLSLDPALSGSLDKQLDAFWPNRKDPQAQERLAKAIFENTIQLKGGKARLRDIVRELLENPACEWVAAKLGSRASSL